MKQLLHVLIFLTFFWSGKNFYGQCVTANPSSFDFGHVTNAQIINFSTLVTNNCTTSQTINGVNFGGRSEITGVAPALPVTISAGSKQQMQFQFKCKGVGAATDSENFTIQTSGATSVQIHTQWQCSAASPVEELSLNIYLFSLEQNSPNPFSTSTAFRYSLERQSQVMLNIYDMMGTRVSQLVNQEEEAGLHSTIFNAKNLPAGCYVARLTTDRGMLVRMMNVVR